jgi:hypothetical protein
MQTHIRFADRLERLILILSIALHWSVSLRLSREKNHQDHAEKRGQKNLSDPNSPFLNVAYAFFKDVASLVKYQDLYGFI